MDAHGRAALAVGGLSLLAKAAGFLRELILAKYFGAGASVDAIVLAMTPYWVLILVVGESLRYSIIPDLAHYEARGGARSFWRRTRWVLSRAIVVGALVSVVLAAGSAVWMKMLAFAAPPETQELATSLAVILCPLAASAIVGNVLTAVLNARGRVQRTALAELAYNGMAIPLIVLLAHRLGIAAAAWGWSLGFVVYVLILAYPLLGRRLPKGKPPLQGTSIIAATLPITIAAAAVPVTNVIDRMVASGLHPGSVASLNYGFKVLFLPLGVVIGALGSVSFPELARRFARGDAAEAGDVLRGDLAVFTVIMAPLASLVAVTASPLIRALFMRGAFDEFAADLTASCLVGYAPAIFLYGATMLLVRAALARGDRALPVVIGAIAVPVNAALDIILGRRFGALGIALAFSITSLVTCVVAGSVILRAVPRSTPERSTLGSAFVAAGGAAALAAALPPVVPNPWIVLAQRGVAGTALAIAVYWLSGTLKSLRLVWAHRQPAAAVAK